VINGQLRKGSPRWRGLRLGRPLSVRCHGHSSIGLCGDCLELFRDVLTDVPRLLDDLDIAIAGETRFVEHGSWLGWTPNGAGGNPYTAAHARIAQALTGASDWFDWSHPEQLARQLLANLDQLADEPTMPRLAGDIAAAAARAHRVIERPEDHIYLGPCLDCGADIYGLRVAAEDDDAKVVCRAPGCGYSSHMAEHRRAQLDAGESRMLTEDELVGAITQVGEVVTRKQIRRWVKHDGVVRDLRQVPRLVLGELSVIEVEVYRLGDIRTLADGENPENIGTITSGEVARQLGVGEDAVRKMVERNKLEPVRRGAKPLRFKLAEVERYRINSKRDTPNLARSVATA
jgi:excisionase family DNA binding protein